ncbi:hypothetical protein Bca52824_018038 [Brassica carinata]|uniref:Uncharacterized protein n=1 Tax=Brassica carinata TaxID=52824 RepID=A0A8X7VP69_BRACI|nr:hypothetical protein Bca52824_018038 [Brassica carinata]
MGSIDEGFQSRADSIFGSLAFSRFSSYALLLWLTKSSSVGLLWHRIVYAGVEAREETPCEGRGVEVTVGDMELKAMVGIVVVMDMEVVDTEVEGGGVRDKEAEMW